MEKERIWEFLWISQACNLKKVLHFCTENDGAERKKKCSANSTFSLHYWSEDKFCHHATNMYLKMFASTTDPSRIPLENLRAQTLYSLMVQNSITSSPFHRVRPKIAMLIAFWHPSYRTQPADVHPTAARHTCPCSMILRDRMMGKQRWTEWFVLLCLIQFTLPFRERVCLHLFYLCKSLTYPVLEERTNWILLPEDSPDLWQPLWVHNSNLSIC